MDELVVFRLEPDTLAAVLVVMERVLWQALPPVLQLGCRLPLGGM